MCHIVLDEVEMCQLVLDKNEQMRNERDRVSDDRIQLLLKMLHKSRKFLSQMSC